MGQAERPRVIPGLTVLGGAAAGFSTEGLMRDALARDEAPRRRPQGRAVETIRKQPSAGPDAERAAPAA